VQWPTRPLPYGPRRPLKKNSLQGPKRKLTDNSLVDPISHQSDRLETKQYHEYFWELTITRIWQWRSQGNFGSGPTASKPPKLAVWIFSLLGCDYHCNFARSGHVVISIAQKVWCDMITALDMIYFLIGLHFWLRLH